MNTINEEDKTNETPLEDLRQQALKHYEDVSTTSNHWSGFIVKAIKAYDPKRDAEVERLRKENEELRADDLSSSEWLRTLNELAALKKQVEEMRTEREFELAYCFGLMASDGVTIDRMAEATTSERWAKIKDEIKKLK